MLKSVLTAAFLAAGVSFSYAGDSCTMQSSAKKLAGAAQTSFMKKCQRDAGTTCDAAAMEKKLSGAARTSFVKKCVSDAVGA